MNLAIHGAGGRMGQRLIALGSADPETIIAAAIESDNHEAAGKDAGDWAGIGPIGVTLSSSLEAETEVDVVIDFSIPSAAMRIIDLCVERRLPLVLATTGFDEEQKKSIVKATDQIPVVWSPNMSLAVNLLMQLAGTAGRALNDYPGGADVEIIDRHHRFKEDAPSGTALCIGEIIADVMGQSSHTHGRQGRPGQRPQTEIGYHALRVGDNPGEHTVVYGLLGEMIELTVRATNRDCYANGALAAAKFIADKKPGHYVMADVLGL